MLSARCSVILLPILFLFSVGCTRGCLYVQQEWIDRFFLASSRVGTPDPNSLDPPCGQRLVISWNLPQSLFCKEPSIFLTVHFWNHTQQSFSLLIEDRKSYEIFYFENKDPLSDRRILTYRVQLITKEGTMIETWEHHFWTELIDLDPSSKSCSVSSQLKQGSVIDTP